MSHRVIFYEPAGKIHPSQWDMLNYPPKGYKFVTTASSLDSVVGNSFVFDKLRLQVLDRMMPLNLTKAWLDTYMRSVPGDSSLIFSYNHPIFRKVPWVVLVEWAHILVGRDLRYFRLFKPMVEKALAADDCKGVITWTEIAKESIYLNYDCRGFEDRINVIPPGIGSKNYDKNYDTDGLKLLFVGSLDDPEDFVMKGGREVLGVFSKLKGKYKGLELVVRANAPRGIEKSLENVTVIRERVTGEILAKLFKEADIYIYPSHKIQDTVGLEAMSYGLPVVATYSGSTCGEYVQDGLTGLVVDGPRNVSYFSEDYILKSESIHRRSIIQDVDKKVVRDLAERVEYLIKKPLLRAYLGKMAKYNIDYGRFSIRHRNMLLNKVFDGAV